MTNLHTSHKSKFVMLAIGVLILLGLTYLMVTNIFVVMADCMWTGTGRAWLDQNRNGIWESEELPLPAVTFILAYDGVELKQESDNSGKAALASRYPCGQQLTQIEVRVEPPSNYELTTPSLINTTFNNEEPLDFGFVLIANDNSH